MPADAFHFSFDAIYYHVKDMDNAVAFYRDILGLKLKSRDYVARFDVDGVLFELVPVHNGETITGPGNARLSLGVSEIQAAVKYLATNGVKATAPKPEVGGILSLFHDPDGNELCLWQNA